MSTRAVVRISGNKSSKEKRALCAGTTCLWYGLFESLLFWVYMDEMEDERLETFKRGVKAEIHGNRLKRPLPIAWRDRMTGLVLIAVKCRMIIATFP